MLGATDAEHERDGGECRAPVIERVLVVGAGTMGSGIAQVIAQAGIRTTLTDADTVRS